MIRQKVLKPLTFPAVATKCVFYGDVLTVIGSHMMCSRDRPDPQEGWGGCRAVRVYIRKDAGIDKPNTERET
jgi:hypothetical protein